MAHSDVPAEFLIRRQLAGSSEGPVYLAESRADGRRVVLKTYPSRDGRSRAYRELDALRSLCHPRIPSALDLIDREVPILVLTYQPGVTLSTWVDTGRPELLAVLEVGVQLASMLTHVHDRHLVHRDITPHNILVEPRKRAAHLIDFGLALPLGTAARFETSMPEDQGLGGTLPFMAPEQTGRMNRSFEFRSDLYALGATFYYVLTGRPPFEGSDPLALVHAHMARQPLDPRELEPSIPEPLARLVLRLLRKDPEERYPSAGVLQVDLGALKRVLEACGSIPEAMRLEGLERSSKRLTFPRRIYGRESEQERLYTLFSRAAAGDPRTVLLSGGAGAGKSTLLDTLRPVVSEASGLLVSGKCDPDRPRGYGAWIAALESLVDQLLLLSKKDLKAVREALCKGLGGVAQALVDLVPDLSLIVGDVAPVPALGPRETRERLALALVRTLSVLATPEHPLVVALEDLHSADDGSLFLLESILCREEPPGALLLVGTFRPEEIEAEHPLRRWMSALADRGVGLEHMEIGTLSTDAATQLLCDVLEARPDEVRWLGQQIEVKTGNSPLLIREFLMNLDGQGLLQCASGKWRWSEEAIRSAVVPEGAVELLVARIERMAPEVVGVLRFSACAADEFDLDLLEKLGGGERAELARSLAELLRTGLIVPVRGGFRFVHDRIREAAQALMEPEAREQLHCETGRFLLEHTSETELAGRVFLLAKHLNEGRRFVPDTLRLRLAHINLLAGQQELASGAVQAASRFLSIGRSLLRDSDWDDRRDLVVEMLLAGADCEFQCSDYDSALQILDLLDARPLSHLERSQIEVKRIQVRALTQSPEEASRYILSVFREMGIRWRLHPSRLRLWIERWRGRRALDRSDYGLRWKAMTDLDPAQLGSLLLLGASVSIVARVDARLTAFMAYRILLAYTRSGNPGCPGMPVAGCALAEVSLAGDPKRARRAAKAALALRERDPYPGYDLRVEFIVHGLVHPWLMHRREALAPLARITEEAQEAGDLEFAYYSALNHSIFLALGGETLSAVDRRLRTLAHAVLHRGHRYPEAVPCLQVHALLLDERPEIEACVERLADAIDQIPPSGVVYVRTLWLQVLCVYGHYDLAFEQSERVFAELFRVVPYLHVADHTFYRGLSAAALASQVSGRTHRTLRSALRDSIRQLARWAKGGPDFIHMATFLRAEHARLRGLPAAAWPLYDQAARGAQQLGFVHHAALAYERKSLSLSQSGRKAEAAITLAKAASLYERWGSAGKLRELQSTSLDRPPVGQLRERMPRSDSQ